MFFLFFFSEKNCAFCGFGYDNNKSSIVVGQTFEMLIAEMSIAELQKLSTEASLI